MPALAISAEVTAALASGRPVVALESTLIAHGLPWPVNLETAREAESTVRSAGANRAESTCSGRGKPVARSEVKLPSNWDTRVESAEPSPSDQLEEPRVTW